MSKQLANDELAQLQAKLQTTQEKLDMIGAEMPDLTIQQIQKKLSCSRPTVYRLIGLGKLKTYKLGRATRITGNSYARFRAEVSA